MTENQASFDWKAFSRMPWVIVVTGLFSPAIGIILTWLKPDWTSKTKLIATGMLALILISRRGGQPASSDTPLGSADTAAANKASSTARSSDTVEDLEYQRGYRYVSEILAATKRAPPSMKKQMMQPLEDLAKEAKENSGKRSPAFYKGASKAIKDPLQDMMNELQ
jgi:hypothetical protein